MSNVVISPNSIVKLCSVDIDSTQENQIWFESELDQFLYFSGKKVRELTEFSYIKKDNALRVPIYIDDLTNCNYVMYQNSSYTTKWFYAFITEMRYINDGCTELILKTDVYQTWFLNCQFLESFVEREHTMNDTPGTNTQPEMLEIGEYVADSVMHDTQQSNLWAIVMVTELLDKDSVRGKSRISGIFTPCYYYAYNMGDEDSLAKMETLISQYDAAGKGDAIQSIFVCPRVFFTMMNIDSGETDRVGGPSEEPASYTIIINDNRTLSDGYVPHNNKLLSFPYRYILASNNAGSSAIYKWENGADFNQLLFKVYGAISPGCSIKLIPMNYKGVIYNHDEGLVGGKLPVLNWTSDVYTNWLTQNSVNLAVGVVSSGAQIVGGVAMMASGAGAAAGGASAFSGAMGIANTIGQIYQHSLTPDQMRGNVNSGDVVAGMRQNGFDFYFMSIKKEYAEIIDDYFTMYGYKTNRVKIPNLSGRPGWNYVKTLSANIVGDVPTKDMEELKAIFNNGVTLWKKDVTIGNYNWLLNKIPVN